MNPTSPGSIGPGGRFLLFAGIPWAVGALFIICGQQCGLDRSLGTTALTCAIFGTTGAIRIGSMVLYNYFPRRLAVPFGVAGWILTFLLLY